MESVTDHKYTGEGCGGMNNLTVTVITHAYPGQAVVAILLSYGNAPLWTQIVVNSQHAHLALDLDAAPVLKGVAGHQQGPRCLASLDAAWGAVGVNK